MPLVCGNCDWSGAEIVGNEEIVASRIDNAAKKNYSLIL